MPRWKSQPPDAPNPTDVKTWLERELGAELPERLWDYVCSKCLSVYEVEWQLRGREEGPSGLLAEVRDLIEAVDPGTGAVRQRRRSEGAAPPETSPTTDDLLAFFTAAERERAVAFSQQAAARVAREKPVRQFRLAVLSDRLLSGTEAEWFVWSPVCRFLTVEQFEELGIPVTDHSAVVTKRAPDRLVLRVTHSGEEVEVTVPIETVPPTNRILFQPKPGGSREGNRAPFEPKAYELARSADTLARVIEYYGSFPNELPPEDLLGNDPVAWAVFHGLDPFPLCAPASPVSELAELSDWIGARLRELWDVGSVARWALTGTAPQIAPIAAADRITWLASLGLDSRHVAISAEHWVSASTIARIWRHLARGPAPPRGRRPNARRDAVLRFVTGHGEPADRAGWRRLRALWNDRTDIPAAWRFPGDGSFRQVYQRAKAARARRGNGGEG